MNNVGAVFTFMQGETNIKEKGMCLGFLHEAQVMEEKGGSDLVICYSDPDTSM